MNWGGIAGLLLPVLGSLFPRGSTGSRIAQGISGALAGYGQMQQQQAQQQAAAAKAKEETRRYKQEFGLKRDVGDRADAKVEAEQAQAAAAQQAYAARLAALRGNVPAASAQTPTMPSGLTGRGDVQAGPPPALAVYGIGSPEFGEQLRRSERGGSATANTPVPPATGGLPAIPGVTDDNGQMIARGATTPAPAAQRAPPAPQRAAATPRRSGGTGARALYDAKVLEKAYELDLIQGANGVKPTPAANLRAAKVAAGTRPPADKASKDPSWSMQPISNTEQQLTRVVDGEVQRTGEIVSRNAAPTQPTRATILSGAMGEMRDKTYTPERLDQIRQLIMDDQRIKVGIGGTSQNKAQLALLRMESNYAKGLGVEPWDNPLKTKEEIEAARQAAAATPEVIEDMNNGAEVDAPQTSVGGLSGLTVDGQPAPTLDGQPVAPAPVASAPAAQATASPQQRFDTRAPQAAGQVRDAATGMSGSEALGSLPFTAVVDEHGARSVKFAADPQGNIKPPLTLHVIDAIRARIMRIGQRIRQGDTGEKSSVTGIAGAIDRIAGGVIRQAEKYGAPVEGPSTDSSHLGKELLGFRP